MTNGLKAVARQVSKRPIASVVIAFLLGAGLCAAIYTPAFVSESQLADKYLDRYLEAPTQAEVDSATRRAAKAEAALGEREEEIAEKEAELDERESEVASIEKKIERNTVTGEGTYEVGVDMKPGTYRAPASPACYWSINADPNGDRIISNDNTDGQFVIRVETGQYLELARCGDLVRQ